MGGRRGEVMAKGFLAALAQASRQVAKEAERQQRAHARLLRERERELRAHQRTLIAEEKERQRQYVESRIDEVKSQNAELESLVDDLSKLLLTALDRHSLISFSSLLVKPDLPELNFGDLLKPQQKPRPESFYPPKPSALIAWVPSVKHAHAQRITAGEQAYQAALQQYEIDESKRLTKLEALRSAHENSCQKALAIAEKQNSELEEFQRAFSAGDPEAIAAYFDMVLDRSPYPEGFPQTARMAFDAESKQLVVEYELPVIDDIVPTAKAYKYVKSNDSIVASARPESQRKALYASVVAQTVLRTLRELFDSDESKHLETVVLNGYVSSIDKGTGQPVRPCVVSVRTTRDVFSGLDLRHVDAESCLKTLNAAVSKSPSELAPVRPILELNMVDPRFVEEADVLSTLDQRPNLLELSPSEFESLITNLFQKMGLETRQTQASRDGGVDCVAFDPRPIFGGKVVIQAKRYKDTVGVSAVRDLFGTMQNEGASKGILVSTSGYGKASFEFANGKPIELLSGSNLLYLLKEHAGIDAKIVMSLD